jgi:hypothetical protein
MMTDYGLLKPPSAQAIEVFEKVLENNPDADMRAIPNQWLLNERGLAERLSTESEIMREALEEIIKMAPKNGEDCSYLIARRALNEDS